MRAYYEGARRPGRAPRDDTWMRRRWSVRLSVGQQAPDFAVVDIYGRRISLRDYAGRKLLLSFHRAAVCPLCNIRTWHIIDRDPTYRRMGLEVVAFYESSPQRTHEYLDRLKAPFPVIADLERKVYDLYG